MTQRIPLSVLELAVVSEDQSGATAIRNGVEVAEVAEQTGYHRIWYAQHHLSPGVASAAPAVLIGAAADRTSRIRVGSGAVLLASTSPVVAAEQFGTLAALHPGRIDLGIGRAFTPPEPTEPPPPPGPGRMVDGLYVPDHGRLDLTHPVLRRRLKAQRELTGARQPEDFRGEVATILGLRDGTFSYADLPYASPPSDGADFELWIVASSGGESARVAGELGLPIAANFHAVPSTVIDTVETYRRSFQPGVRDEPYVIVSADVLAADTEKQARELGEPFAAWVRAIRTGVDGAIALPPPGTTPPVEEWPEKDRLTVADRLSTRIVGTVDQVIDGLDRLAQATQADELLITTETYRHADRLHSFRLLAAAWGQDHPGSNDTGDIARGQSAGGVSGSV